MHLLDEVLEHFFCHEEVGDNAVFHRANSCDVARGTSICFAS
jgi:hypothetical protein